MRALAVTPGTKDSARLIEVAEPQDAEAGLVVEMLATGVCGTDREIIDGKYGEPPLGCEYLIIGHETLGRVLVSETPAFAEGDLVVGIVRRPDPVPCAACAGGQWDMCQNGLFTERGIKQLHGYGSERYRLDPRFAVRVDPKLASTGVLIEPASVVAKAWEQIERIGRRAHFHPEHVLVTGAGPIGLLAAVMGSQRGYQMHVLDRITDGPKPKLVKELGAHYYTELKALEPLRNKFDIVLECTGSTSLVLEVMNIAGPNSIVCLTGVSSGHRVVEADIGCLTRQMVLENGVVFGSVNSNRAHYEAAISCLCATKQSWLEQIITRRVPLDHWPEALDAQETDVKTVIVPS